MARGGRTNSFYFWYMKIEISTPRVMVVKNRQFDKIVFQIIRTSIVKYIKNMHGVFFLLHIISNWFSNIFLQKILHFLQPVKSKTIGIGNSKGQFIRITLPEKLLKVLCTNDHISKSRRSMNLILVSNWSWKCTSYNDTTISFYSKRHLFHGSASHL